MKCSIVAEKISLIIDEEAGIITRLRFYGHLLICPKCRQYYSQFKSLKNATGQIHSEELPADFDQVMNFVMDEIENKQESKKDLTEEY